MNEVELSSHQESPIPPAALQPATQTGFLSLSREAWTQHPTLAALPKFRAKQVADWVFYEHAIAPDEMSNLPKSLRDVLKNEFDWSMPTIKSQLNSADGSTKLLLQAANGQFIESVILRYENRVSLCVSSQVGCKMACSFCQTGKLGFVRNLTAHEILAQYVMAARIVKAEGRRLSHVVFMGMGEPLDNYAAVVAAVNALTSPDGFGLSARHVTVSTSGIATKIQQLATDARCALAVSLHAARDDLRDELMPINRRWNLAELKSALEVYQRTTGDKITIEYILIRGKNCSLREAKDLVKFIHGLRAKVNLIPFNAHPGLPHERPSDDEIRSFQSYLAERSIAAPVRYSKGLDVSGACGQLAAKTLENLDAKPERKSLLAPRQNQTSVHH